jgi:hypothetical protein
VSDILAPEVLSGIDTFYDSTLKPKPDAIDDPRRQVRWLIVKSLMVVLAPIAVLLAGDLIDSVLPITFGVGALVLVWVWLAAGLVFVLVKLCRRALRTHLVRTRNRSTPVEG